MKFIRENLFYLILVAAVVILGGMLLAVDYTYSDDVTAEMAARDELSTKLQGLAKPGGLVNEGIVAAEANRVRMIVGEANAILKRQAAMNRLEHYKVLYLPVIENGQSRMQLPAFPYDANMYRDYELSLQFIQLHREAVQDRLRALEPTRLPTIAEIAVARQILEVNPTAAEGGAGTDLANLNLQRATDYAVYEKATAGRMYVDDAAIFAEVSFAEGRTTATPVELWIKQYKLWLVTDLIAVLKTANEEGLKDLGNGERNVLNAPVKRFYSLKVSDTYATTGGAGGAPPPTAVDTGGGGGGGGGGDIGGPPARGPSPMMGGGEFGGARGPTPEMGMRGPRPEMGGGGGVIYNPVIGGGGGVVQATGETVTRHYSTPEMDVIQYNFQVVMPTRHVPLLMRTLMRGRNHSVLSYKAQDAPKQPGYFYGNEPVMLVTFTCEAVFLTSWERDFVPPEFLKNNLPGDILRNSDKDRLPK